MEINIQLKAFFKLRYSFYEISVGHPDIGYIINVNNRFRKPARQESKLCSCCSNVLNITNNNAVFFLVITLSLEQSKKKSIIQKNSNKTYHSRRNKTQTTTATTTKTRNNYCRKQTHCERVKKINKVNVMI